MGQGITSHNEDADGGDAPQDRGWDGCAVGEWNDLADQPFDAADYVEPDDPDLLDATGFVRDPFLGMQLRNQAHGLRREREKDGRERKASLAIGLGLILMGFSWLLFGYTPPEGGIGSRGGPLVSPAGCFLFGSNALLWHRWGTRHHPHHLGRRFGGDTYTRLTDGLMGRGPRQ